jgi:branched-chain amino acid transport system permease protein
VTSNNRAGLNVGSAPIGKPRTREWIVWPLFGLLLVAIPHLVSNQYVIRILIEIILYSILTMSLNLLVGFTGQFSLGHAGFYAIGAYTSALLMMKAGMPYIVALMGAIVITSLMGVVVAVPSFRLGGDYLAIATLGFSEVIRLILLNWQSLTRGPLGLAGVPAPDFFGITRFSLSDYYYYVLALAVLAYFTLARIIDSQIGRCLMAVRDDEVAAAAMGVNVRFYKTLAFIISAAWAGVCGSFFASFLNFLSPTSFTVQESVLMIAMVILGGMGSLPGSVLGATLLVAIPEYFQVLYQARLLLAGAAILLMVLFRPKGILGDFPVYLRRRPKLVRTART